MLKETKELAQAIENLLVFVLGKESAPEVLAPKNEPAPVHASGVHAPVVPPAPAVTVVPAPVMSVPDAAPVAQGPVSHDEVRALLLPIIQSNQEAMTAVHSILTGTFKVNELTSLPVAQIPEFMAAVNAALEA